MNQVLATLTHPVVVVVAISGLAVGGYTMHRFLETQTDGPSGEA